MAAGVWVRVLLPQVMGLPSLAPDTGSAGGKSAPSSAQTASAVSATQPPAVSQLSQASVDRCFAFLDGLLRSADVKHMMVEGLAAANGAGVVPIVPPLAIVSISQVGSRALSVHCCVRVGPLQWTAAGRV